MTSRCRHSFPGVAPTGRAVMLPVVVVVGFEADKIAYERIYWDQGCLLVQVGLLKDFTEASLPVCGVAQARKVLDKDLPANTLLHTDQPGPPAVD
jgi:carboxymethylenebutenolidase